MNESIQLNAIDKYYSSKIEEFGCTPQGVDWNGIESQTQRFEQLLKICDESKLFSINDLGCGYGAFFDFLNDRKIDCNYEGIDLSEAMIRKAKDRHRNFDRANYVCGSAPSSKTDFCVASGIFNVQLDYPQDQWLNYIHSTLTILDNFSTQGFAFNCLTSYSDPEKKRDYLFYADPVDLFRFCKDRFSRNVALLHDYGLYEFTILVRKIV